MWVDRDVTGRCAEARSPASGRRIVLGLAALLLVAAEPSGAEIINRILATIDGDPVTLYELQQFSAAEVRARQIPMPESAAVLDALITQRIIDKEFEQKGLSVKEEDVDRYIDSIRQRNQLTEEQLAAALDQQGISMERYREQIRGELQRAQLINREIRGKVNVTPEEVERYYEAHLDEYSKPSGIVISHILLRLPPDASDEEVENVRQRAEQIHAQLDAGADFGELAREFSEDAAAESGGVLGEFREGEMLEALEKAVEDLQPGQYSEPVRSSVGIHIVRLDDRLAESHEPLESLAEEIKQKLYNEALEERYARWLREDLRERHHVEILQ